MSTVVSRRNARTIMVFFLLPSALRTLSLAYSSIALAPIRIAALALAAPLAPPK